MGLNLLANVVVQNIVTSNNLNNAHNVEFASRLTFSAC